jgi:hypothetical protein
MNKRNKGEREGRRKEGRTEEKKRRGEEDLICRDWTLSIIWQLVCTFEEENYSTDHSRVRTEVHRYNLQRVLSSGT